MNLQSILYLLGATILFSGCIDPVENGEVQQAEVTAEQLKFTTASHPGDYSYYDAPLPDGGVWLEGGGDRRSAFRATWHGDTVITTEVVIGNDAPNAYITNWADRALVHTDGPNFRNGPAILFEEGNQYPVELCNEPDMRCGSGAMRKTPIGLLIGAAIGPYGNKDYSLRWLASNANADVKVRDWPNALNDFIVGVASYENWVMGAYYVESPRSDFSNLIPFKFDITSPASTYSEGPAISHHNTVVMRGNNSSIGVADDQRFAIYTLDGPLSIHSINWRNWGNYSYDSLNRGQTVWTPFESGLGTYHRTSRGQRNDLAYYIDLREHNTSQLMRCTPSGPVSVWEENLRPIRFSQTGESLGETGISGGEFRVFSKRNSFIYVKNSLAILEIDEQAESVTRAWTVAADAASTNLEMPDIWSARVFDDTLHVMAVENLLSSSEVLLLSKVGL